MSRRSGLAGGRSMRISVQKYIDDNAAREQQRRLARRQQDEQQQQPAVVAAGPEVAAASPNSGNRAERSSKSAVVVPRRQPNAEAPGPSGVFSENRENPKQNPRNGNDGADNAPRNVIGNEPPAPVAAPPAAAVEIVVRDNEAAQQRNFRNGFERPEYQPRIILRPQNSRQHGRDFGKRNSRQTYVIDLAQRILSDRNEKTVQRLMETAPLEDFCLVSRDGEQFPCHKELLQNMCLCIDISNSWNVSQLVLDSSRNITGRIVDFAFNGTITIGDHNILAFMEAADFLGFESLLQVCVDHARRQCGARRIVEVHARFSHVDGVRKIFETKLDRMPIHLFYPRGEPSDSLLQSLSFEQLRMILASDSLLVTKEDQVVTMIVDWLKQHEVSEKQKEILYSLVRYPFLLKTFADSLDEGTSDLLITKSEDLSDVNSCGWRSGYDHHVHILWQESFPELQGPQSISISCVSWNKNVKNFHEKVLVRSTCRYEYREEGRSLQYTAVGKKIVKLSFNRDHDEIFVSEVDLKSGTNTRRRTVNLVEESVVDRPDPVVIKGTSDLKISYHNIGTDIMSFNTNTWETTLDHTANTRLRNFPIYPHTMQIFEDYFIGHTSKRVVISNANFTDPIEVHMPDTEGYLIDFERVKNDLFILETNSLARHARRRMPNLVHCIDVKNKIFRKTIALPLLPEPRRNGFGYQNYHWGMLRFLKSGSELFILNQIDDHQPNHIYAFDAETLQTKLVAVLEHPPMDKSPCGEERGRSFGCIVPTLQTPCDKTRVGDLRTSSRAPSSQ